MYFFKCNMIYMFACTGTCDFANKPFKTKSVQSLWHIIFSSCRLLKTCGWSQPIQCSCSHGKSGRVMEFEITSWEMRF